MDRDTEAPVKLGVVCLITKSDGSVESVTYPIDPSVSRWPPIKCPSCRAPFANNPGFRRSFATVDKIGKSAPSCAGRSTKYRPKAIQLSTPVIIEPSVGYPVKPSGNRTLVFQFPRPFRVIDRSEGGLMEDRK